MSVRITTGEPAALYDSTSGIAFGPVFTDDQDAQLFLDWLKHGHANELTFKFKKENVRYHYDPRSYTPDELVHVFNLWVEELDKEVSDGN